MNGEWYVFVETFSSGLYIYHQKFIRKAIFFLPLKPKNSNEAENWDTYV